MIRKKIFKPPCWRNQDRPRVFLLCPSHSCNKENEEAVSKMEALDRKQIIHHKTRLETLRDTTTCNRIELGESDGSSQNHKMIRKVSNCTLPYQNPRDGKPLEARIRELIPKWLRWIGFLNNLIELMRKEQKVSTPFALVDANYNKRELNNRNVNRLLTNLFWFRLKMYRTHINTCYNNINHWKS